MRDQHRQGSNNTTEIKGGQKVVKSAPELAGLDDRTTLDENRSGKDLKGSASEGI